jgi:hypothetical protein
MEHTKEDTVRLKIKSRPGLYVLIDKEDLPLLGNRSVFLTKGDYPAVGINHRPIVLHRIVLKYKGRKDIDHKNRNKLDCRKGNLRIVSRSINMLNNCKECVQRNGSGWMARITVNYKGVYLGTFRTKEAAINAVYIKKNELGI